jgi:hypothetical protein
MEIGMLTRTERIVPLLRHVCRKAAIALFVASAPASAQTTLPSIDVTAPKWQQRHGGYLVSSNFSVDSRMSAVVYPAEPFEKDDILSVRFAHMKDDEYFVLQECVSADCTQARVVRAWNAYGALGATAHEPDRVWIPHEGKYFMWMQRIPMSGFNSGPFTGYKPLGPPLVFNPTGTSEQFRATDVAVAQEKGPEKVVSSTHDGMSFVLRFEGGTSALIQRMHAAD